MADFDTFLSTPDTDNTNTSFDSFLGNGPEKTETSINAFSDDEFEKKLQKVEAGIQSSDILKQFLPTIRNIKDSNLSPSDKATLWKLFDLFLESSDKDKKMSLILQFNKVHSDYKTDSDSITNDAREDEAEVKDETKITELDKTFTENFGERWERVKDIFDISTIEDYNAFSRIMDLLGETAGFIFLDVIYDIFLEDGVLPALGKIGNSVWYILEKDGELLSGLATSDEEGSWVYLGILVYAHINLSLYSWRRFKDYMIVRRGEKMSKLGNKEITLKDGTKTTVERFRKRVFGKFYLNAARPNTNIFSFEGEGGSAEQNEYVKRKKVIEILKGYFHNNPKALKRLSSIETGTLQANTVTFWRQLWRLCEGHTKFRRIVGGTIMPEHAIPWIGKSEKETNIMAFVRQVQDEHLKNMEILFKTSSISDNTDTIKQNGIEPETTPKSDFLEGLILKIENNPNISSKEKAKRIARLNAFLNRMTSSTIVKDADIKMEVMRIYNGDMSQIEMLDRIEAELKKQRSGGMIRRNGGAVVDYFLRRKSNLLKLQKAVAKGKYNGTEDEFNNLLKKVKKSKIIVRIPTIKRNYIEDDFDKFKIETETAKVDFEKREKLYGKDSIKHLENYIRYILPNESEETYDKILKEFKDRKTLYSEIDFYRELDRMQRGFLPSNIVIEKLEEIKTKLEAEKVRLDKEKIGVWKKITGLKFVLQDSSITWVDSAEKVKFMESLDLAAIQFSDGDYKGSIKTLGEMSKRFTGKVKEEILQIINKIKRIKDVRIRQTAHLSPERMSIEGDIENIDKHIAAAMRGELDFTQDNIDDLEKNKTPWNPAFVSPEKFTEESQKAVKEELEKYKGIDAHDFKATLEKSSNPTDIKASLEKRFAKEFGLFRIFQKLHGDSPKWFDNSISQLANSIHENDYTKGQISGILDEIISYGTAFGDVDIDTIIKNTSEHHADFDQKAHLDEIVSQKYTAPDLDPAIKEEVQLYITRNGIDEGVLPEKIATDMVARRKSAEAATRIKTQKNRLEAVIRELEDDSRIWDADSLNRIEDAYRDLEIDPGNEILKDIDEEFKSLLRDKRAELSKTTPTPKPDDSNIEPSPVKPDDSSPRPTPINPENAETLRPGEMKKYLDDVYPSVLLTGNSDTISKFEAIYGEYVYSAEGRKNMNSLKDFQDFVAQHMRDTQMVPEKIPGFSSSNFKQIKQELVRQTNEVKYANISYSDLIKQIQADRDGTGIRKFVLAALKEIGR